MAGPFKQCHYLQLHINSLINSPEARAVGCSAIELVIVLAPTHSGANCLFVPFELRVTVLMANEVI